MNKTMTNALSIDNKTLAVCLSYIKREVGQMRSVLREDVLTEISAALEHHSQQLIAESVVHAHESAVFELPDELVYTVHLEDATASIHERIASINNDLLESIVATRDALVEASNDSSVEFSERIADVKRSADESIKVLNESIESNSAEFQHNVKAIIEDFASRDKEVREALKESNSSIREDLTREFSIELQQVALYMSTSTANLANSMSQHISSVVSDLNNAIESAKREIQIQLNSLNDKLQLNNRTLLNSVEQQVTTLDRNKSDIDHIHDHEYSKLGHSHDQYAMRDDLTALLNKYHQDERVIAQQLHKLEQSLDKKANIDDVLNSKNRQILIDDVRDIVVRSIRTPTDGVDGKSAHEWDIKWHPNIKGRLGVKRDDWKDYKWQDLLVKTPAHGGLPPVGFIGGAGSTLPEPVVTSVNGQVGDVILTLEDLGGSSTPEAGIITRDGNGDIDMIAVGTKTTTILRSGSTITGVNKGTYTKNFVRDGSGNITGWTIS